MVNELTWSRILFLFLRAAISMNFPRKRGARWEMAVSLVVSLDCLFRLLICITYKQDYSVWRDLNYLCIDGNAWEC
jgi:hypothetical protein